jgi:hypothetical protein
MKLAFKRFDGRSFNDHEIRDIDSHDRVVGWIASGRQTSGIHINLFDGKYTTTVPCFEECRGFVEGVEKVLNHMMSLTNESVPGPKPQYLPLVDQDGP